MPYVPEPSEPAVPLHEVVSAAALRAMRADASASDPGDPTEWLRLRRDHYMSQETWDSLRPTERLQVLALVVSASAERRKAASHCTAGSVWSIPLIGPVPRQVEIVVPDGSAGRSPGVIQHRSQNFPDAVLHNGVWVTPPARTAVDLARVRTLASGVAAVDHVLHHGMATRAELVREREAIPRGGRGRQKARLAVALADERSESAGESLSRARLFELGYPRPVLQHEFHDERGVFVGRPDMYWRQHKTIGEFDGRVKYRVQDVADPEEAGRIVWDEKQREDALRRLDLSVARWIWDDAFRPERFQAVLAAYGLRPAADPSWLERF